MANRLARPLSVRTTIDDNGGLRVGLSRAQAVEVATRLSPSPGQVLWFGTDGTLLTRETVAAAAAMHGEVYACRSDGPGQPVEVARVRDAGPGVAPDFGAPW